MTIATTFERSVEALRNRDIAAFAATYAPDAVVYDPQYPDPLRGRAAIEKDVSDLFRAFPDAEFSFSTNIVEGDVQAVEWAFSATNSGPLPLPTGKEVPATGKTVSFTGCVISRYNAQGEIVEERRYYDLLNQLQQLGLA